MKKTKRIIRAVALGTLMAMTLAACAGSSQPATNSGGAASSAQEGGAAPAAGGEGIFKIGAIGPLTGDGAAYGQAVVNGSKLAVDEINAAGGINGFQVEHRGEDDELNNEKSMNAYNTLKDWGMQMLVGPTTSGCTIAVSDLAHEDNLFLLTPSGTALDCVKYDNAFRVCFSDPAQGTEAAQYMSEKGIGTKYAVIYDSSDPYSSGIYESFNAEAQAQGLEIVSAEAFTSDSNKDFSVQLQKAKEGGADLVFLPIYYNQAALILQQAADMDYHPTFFGCDGMDGILTVENFDTSLTEGLILMTPFSADSEDEMTVSFVQKYQEQFGEVPNQFAADAYDGVYALKAAIEAKGLTPDMSASDICTALMEAFPEITITGLTSSSLSWDASGEPNKEPRIFAIEGGKYVVQ
ncbi:MAG: ABC transporter substrate-binding protein [Lachnospiraceae bacterium]|nr:ABC transporter substrate-binding protein [Lachnospiraceae bacterium]